MWFRPVGGGSRAGMPIPCPSWHTKTFGFHSAGRGADFTERDRLVLDVLKPHRAPPPRVGDAPAATGRAHRVSGDARKSDVASSSSRQTTLLVTLPRRASARARILRRNGQRDQSTRTGRLAENGLADPASTARRATADDRASRRPAAARGDARRARPHAARAAGSSPKSRGEDEAEIAELFLISPTTVRKHLENVYAKRSHPDRGGGPLPRHAGRRPARRVSRQAAGLADRFLGGPRPRPRKEEDGQHNQRSGHAEHDAQVVHGRLHGHREDDREQEREVDAQDREDPLDQLLPGSQGQRPRASSPAASARRYRRGTSRRRRRERSRPRAGPSPSCPRA